MRMYVPQNSRHLRRGQVIPENVNEFGGAFRCLAASRQRDQVYAHLSHHIHTFKMILMLDHIELIFWSLRYLFICMYVARTRWVG